MAIQTRSLGSFNDNTVSASLSFDDASPFLITQLELVNTGVAGVMSYEIRDRTTGTLLPIPNNPGSVPFNSGTIIRDTTGLNQHMIPFTSPHGGPGFETPFLISLSWNSNP